MLKGTPAKQKAECAGYGRIEAIGIVFFNPFRVEQNPFYGYCAAQPAAPTSIHSSACRRARIKIPSPLKF